MNEIVAGLLKNIDIKQANDLLGKLPKDKDGKLDTELVGKIAKLLGANKDALFKILPGVIQRSSGEKGGKLDVKTLLSSIDIKELAKIIPCAGAVKIAQEVSKAASKKIDEASENIQVAESDNWKGSSSKKIIAAAEKAVSYANADETAPAVLKTYRDLAQAARDSALARKELLLKSGVDKFSDPVAEMNAALIKASKAVRTLDEKIEAAEKKVK